MSIDNRSGQHEQMSVYPGSPAEAHSMIALEQAALYTTRLAIARWINAGMDPMLPIATSERASSRAIWYAQAQQNFREWLGRGGFAQYDPGCAEHAESFTPPASGIPPADTDTHPADTCVD